MNKNKIIIYSILFACTTVFAEENKPKSVSDFLLLSIEELLNVPITSASYFKETSLTTGSTVTVLTPQYWEKRGARRTEDVLQYLPGVNMTPGFVGTKNLVIRGFPNSNGTGVQTLWDGVPINTYPVGNALVEHPNIQLNTLNSIEVIRGPSSALYGSDAFTGVLSLNAFETTNELNSIQTQVATNGYYSAAYKGSTKIGNDLYLNLAIAGNGQPDQDFEYQYTSAGNTFTSERDYKYNSHTATLKLFSDPEKDFSYKVGVYKDDYTHDDFFHNGTDVPGNDLADIDNDMTMYKAEAKWQLDKQRSLTINAHQWDTTHEFARIVPNLNEIHIFSDEKQIGANIIYKDEALLPDTQLSLVLGRKENKATNAHRYFLTPANAIVGALPLFFNDSRRVINSFLMDANTSFANGEYILKYGFRNDDYSDFGNQLTPRLGLIKKLSENSVVKLLYGNAFRAPAANELFGGPIQTGDLNLTPEEIDTYELIYLFENNKRKTEIVIFKSELTNSIQLVDSTPDFYANVGAKNTSEGIEVSHRQNFDHWQLDTSASYIKSRNKSDGYDYGTFPKYILNFGVGYKFENKWLLFVNNRVHLDADREPNTATFDSADLKDYWRTDVHVSKKYSDKLNVFANIRNVLNRQNELPSLQNSVRSTQFLTGIQDEEISLDVGVRYQF